MFKKAEKKRVYLKLAVTGPSGAGKTMGALRMARGIVGPEGKIGLIDTENDSASLYADATPPGGIVPIEFDSAVMAPPFLVNKYTQMIQGAEKAGYDVLIIDSLTHAWQELLTKKDALDSRGGNSFTNFGVISKDHEIFKAALLQSRIHIIGCMRSKQAYVLETSEKGKQAPKKVGMAPIQRDGMEYEFTCVFDVGMDHQYQVSKDRTGIFDGITEVMSERTGEQLMNWMQTEGDFASPIVPDAAPPPRPMHHGKTNPKPPPPPAEALISKDQSDQILSLASTHKIDTGELTLYCQTAYGKSGRELTANEAENIINFLADEHMTSAKLMAEVVRLQKPKPPTTTPPSAKPAPPNHAPGASNPPPSAPTAAPPAPVEPAPAPEAPPTQQASTEAVQALWNEGMADGFSQANMDGIVLRCSGHSNWDDLTNAQVRAVRVAMRKQKQDSLAERMER